MIIAGMAIGAGASTIQCPATKGFETLRKLMDTKGILLMYDPMPRYEGV